MPDKFVVPQFIDSEDKIIGPITVRQFLICLGASFLVFIEFKILSLAFFILALLPTVGVAATFAFVKINGQPFHIFFLNAIQTVLRPNMRVWDKELSADEVRQLLANKPVKQEIVRAPVKERPAVNHLRDLALTVNTGGVYNPDDET